MQPHCAPALISIAKLELSRGVAGAADRALEQALSGDFSVRNSLLFRLLVANIRSMQCRTDEALSEIESLLQLNEVRTPGGVDANSPDNAVVANLNGFVKACFDPLRLTDDDRVGAFILHASLLTRMK